MKKAILTIGISASGKSTWAREYIETSNVNIVEINRDNVRFGIIGVEDWSKWAFTPENEDRVTEVCTQQMDDAIRRGDNIIVSDTNLTEHFIKQTVHKLVMNGYEVSIKWMPIDLDEALRRNAARSNPVRTSVIDQQYQKFNSLYLKYNQ
jgi:predicted kinase